MHAEIKDSLIINNNIINLINLVNIIHARNAKNLSFQGTDLSI